MIKANFHQLQVFHTVAKLGSFSKAAAELSISQPAVSIQVKELEKSMGGALLHRMHRRLQLTDTGHAVFNHAQRIFAIAEEMQTAVQDIKGLKTGRLTIGSSTTPGEYILPWVIGQFRRKFPEIEVSLSITNTQSVVETILNHELDMGMAGAPVTAQGLASFPYVSDQIAIVAAPTHPLSSRRKVKLQDLEGQDFILREPGSATRKTAEACFAEHGVSVKAVMELGSNEAVKRAVAAELGLGTVSIFGGDPRHRGGSHKSAGGGGLAMSEAPYGVLPRRQTPDFSSTSLLALSARRKAPTRNAAQRS